MKYEIGEREGSKRKREGEEKEEGMEKKEERKQNLVSLNIYKEAQSVTSFKRLISIVFSHSQK